MSDPHTNSEQPRLRERIEELEAEKIRLFDIAARETKRARRAGEADGALNKAATGAAFREGERAEKAEQERDEAHSSAEHWMGRAERAEGALRLLQNGPDTLTQNGLQIVNDALYSERGDTDGE